MKTIDNFRWRLGTVIKKAFLFLLADLIISFSRKFGEPKIKKLDNPKFKEEEESLRKRFTEQVKAEETRFRQWEMHLIAERDRLNKDLETAHAVIKGLEQELGERGF
jgi:septin family protein